MMKKSHAAAAALGAALILASCATRVPLERGGYSRAVLAEVVLDVDAREEAGPGGKLELAKGPGQSQAEADRAAILAVADIVGPGLARAGIAEAPESEPELDLPFISMRSSAKRLEAAYAADPLADALVRARAWVRFESLSSGSISILGVGRSEKRYRPILNLSLEMRSAGDGRLLWSDSAEIRSEEAAVTKGVSLGILKADVVDPEEDVDYAGLAARAIERILEGTEP